MNTKNDLTVTMMDLDSEIVSPIDQDILVCI